MQRGYHCELAARLERDFQPDLTAEAAALGL
jgi:hypothetical protein